MAARGTFLRRGSTGAETPMRRMRHEENARIKGGERKNGGLRGTLLRRGSTCVTTSTRRMRREMSGTAEGGETKSGGPRRTLFRRVPTSEGSPRGGRGLLSVQGSDHLTDLRGGENPRSAPPPPPPPPPPQQVEIGGDASTTCGQISSRRSLLGAGSCQVDRRAPPAKRTEDGGRRASYRRMEDIGAPIGIWKRSSHQARWGPILSRPALAKRGWGLLFPLPPSSCT